MGRFAIELFEGPTLIERVRFDFPMLGPPEPLDAGYMAPPSLQKNLTTRIGVMFPAVNRGTRLELWDRATDQEMAAAVAAGRGRFACETRALLSGGAALAQLTVPLIPRDVPSVHATSSEFTRRPFRSHDVV